MFPFFRKLPESLSFCQAWSPGWAQGSDGKLNRPNLVMLASEAHGLPCCSEFMEHRLSPVQMADWLSQCFSTEDAPAELIVDDPLVQGAVRFRYSRTRVVLKNEPTLAWRTAFGELTLGHPEHIACCILTMLGPAGARKAFAAAQQFFENEPWRRIPVDAVFGFQTGQHHLGVTVSGCGYDKGLYVYPSPEAAIRGQVEPMAALSAGHLWTVHHEDLNFIERHGLKLPRKYPFFQKIPGWLTKRELKDLVWLAARLAEWTHSEEVVQDGRRQLSLCSERVQMQGNHPRWLCHFTTENQRMVEAS